MSAILDFQIQPLSAESYSLTVCERGSSQPLATTTFSHRVDFLTDFSVDRLNASTKDAAERFDELQKLGRELYQKLFPPAVEQVWHEYKQRSEFLILCLRFAEGATKLEVLPWETLHDGAEFIAAGAKTTLTRLPLDVAPPNQLPLIPRPLKLFGFFASPLDLQDHERLNAEREQEILLEAINDLAAQGRISADFEDEAKLENLARSLRDGYHILHFTGHGISPRDGGGLLLEDAHGKKLPASIAEVMQAVESGVDKLRLAVISGCQTARTLHTGAFNDLARELLRQRVPAVIAMQFSITDEGRLKFAEVSYREIAKGVELERAVHAVRRALLHCEHNYLKADALAPVLLAANGECLKTTEAEVAIGQSQPVIDPAYFLVLPQLGFGFYGRRREYRQIRDGLLLQNHRAVIIHGIGGIGKTALVSHTAERLRQHFKGVYALDCRSGAIAPETILRQLNFYFANQGINALQQLVGQSIPPEMLANFVGQVLSQWPMLLIFDNFEDLLDEDRRIADENLRAFIITLIKTTAKGSHFLFTTRYRFDLDSKRLGNIQELALDDLSRAEVLNLMQRLPNLARASHNEKLAAFEKFGGHPYAIVTLDRHCHHQPLSRALEEASKLHAELREFLAIELNYRRLTEHARELLNRLAALRQAVPFAAAEWVMGEKVALPAEFVQIMRNLDVLPEESRNQIPDKLITELKALDDDTVQQMLEKTMPEQRQAQDVSKPICELIDWGLCTPYHEDGALQALSVHSLVRDFCRDQQQSETWCMRLRNAAAYYTNQTKLLGKYNKTEDAVWAEMEAFELLIEAEDFSDAANILWEVDEILRRWGYVRYLESQYNRLLNKLDQLGVAKIKHYIGVLLRDRGDYDESLEHLQFAHKIFEEIGYREGLADSHHEIGTLYSRRGDYDLALKHYELSLKIKEELGDPVPIAQTLHQIGVIYQHLKDYDAALQHYQLSLKIKEEHGDLSGIASSHHQIGTIYQSREDYDAALQHYQLSLGISEKLGNRAYFASSHCMIGTIHQAKENYDAALQHYQLSHKIFEELGDRDQFANVSVWIGCVLIKTGGYAEALMYILSALSTFIELQSPNARIAIINLKFLRDEWGEREFDVAWRKVTGKKVPDG